MHVKLSFKSKLMITDYLFTFNSAEECLAGLISNFFDLWKLRFLAVC